MKYLAALLFLCFYTTAAQAFDACAPDTKTQYVPIAQNLQKTLLYRIEKCGKPASYLFGTMHADDPAFNPIIDRILPALNSVKTAGFEIATSPEVAAKVTRYLTFPAEMPTGLYDMIGAEYFKKLVDAMQGRMPAPIINRLRPWAAAVLLGYPKDKADGKVVDDKIQQLAKKLGKQVYGLETIEEQFGIFEEMSEKQQLDMLFESLEDIKESQEMMDGISAAYQQEDMPKLLEYSINSWHLVDDKALAAYLEEAIFTKRNRLMVERMEKIMLHHSTLVAVGAFHLPGDKGMLQLLEANGYFIIPVVQ